ncbi:hypothetical protein COCC4DRAFT_159196 [Bipolaris maydis ATCC 48331]|uniref:Uncharacterized protein n=2 Tax=Cochliobolus heterostrophus TaxID=5016 RepID=M2UAV7_COCH5|nr:uncharacterized protein COCC4DRAFT_159196 [Bipolaris maydis ATCC 48331]EMD90821.1 hypothetical protein COCHEDRAFT_1140640 [Bipolaris maydis C5]KAJ5023408.1 hypothetical protein J3E73DRAFT_216304 [Bipolaris maydis]ENI08969.1 hypothetical protein COCC4DRAFT_159196 [Bipolaris maydis ATCC 48331]KAJ6195906.1 hypothetical protein J3E72DRAFT_247552 [Bipolaris maydis]KAJ6206698.1 hypothetical protein PSV09DRAFT_1140640 [Bipolaris maydis]
MRHGLSQTHRLKRDASMASGPAVPHGFDIKPTALLEDDSFESYPYDVSWYDCWVRYQMKSQPRDLYSVLETEAKRNDIPILAFATIWHEVWVQASKSDSSIDSIVTCLFDKKLANMHDDTESLSHATNLVFAIIGWQTMLYKPDTGSCPRAQLAIADETDGYRGYAYMNLRQDQGASGKALCEFLKGFGVLLPGYNFSTLASDDDKRALAATKILTPDLFNVHLLTNIGGIQIRWTDSLACHLEFDADSSMLYLFRFPTFCAINLLGQEKYQNKPTIHSCAAPPITASYWATYEDINDLLREILLSYRLLFGQNKASRRLFRSLTPFKDLPERCKDHSLSELCGRKQINFGTQLPERDSYILSKDFPILRSRLATLAYHFSNKRPRTWKELWNDKRNSASWFTFWAVLIFGGIGIILAFVQVVLQIVQVSLQIKQP